MNNNDKYMGTNTQQTGIVDVLLLLKDNIMNGLNVATLGTVEDIDKSSGKVQVKPFPLVEDESSKIITCLTSYKRQVKSAHGSISGWGDFTITDFEYENKDLLELLKKGDIVLVIFTNRSSEQSFKQLKNGSKASYLIYKSDLHSDSNGIIVDIIYTK